MKNNYIKDIVKEYPNMYRITVFNRPKNRYIQGPVKLVRNNDKQELNISRSVRRSKLMISDYVLSNDFDMFVTFTFNPRKVNRYDISDCYIKMQGWLWRQQRKTIKNSLKYIIVPEKHKDGAIHFHALISGYVGGIKKTKVIQNNKRVYNLTSFRYGFTNAQYLDDDKLKAAAYISKYITKDMVLISNRRRYWCSKNLLKPAKYYNEKDEMNLNTDLDSLIYQNHYLKIHEIKKVQELFA